MNSAIDRMWVLRDAVLVWQYVSTANGNRYPTVDVDEIQELSG